VENERPMTNDMHGYRGMATISFATPLRWDVQRTGVGTARWRRERHAAAADDANAVRLRHLDRHRER
jgi:hypothetical protein